MFTQYASGVNEIDVSRLVYSKNILRENFEELDELIQSIREHGLLNPLIVREKDGMFEIIAGHRRFEACKRLGWTRIHLKKTSITKTTRRSKRKNYATSHNLYAKGKPK